jgi:hypothetical protein
MDRRAAVIWVGWTVLAGCGGGGGSSVSDTGAGAVSAAPPPPAPAPAETPAPAPAPAPAAAPAPAPAPAPAAAPQANANIAAWGDSLTPLLASNLQELYPAREVYDGGIIGNSSSEVLAREQMDTSGHNAWINIFWFGHVNDNFPDQVKADIAKSVAALAPGNSRFIVLSLLNKANGNEVKGGPGYATILQLNRDLAASYPQNYLEVRSFLVNQYDPSNAQDVIDFQNDVVPSSLRFPNDEIHLMNKAESLLARRVQQFIDAKGW